MTSPEMIYDHKIHPAASVFPLMEGEAFQSLVDSIAVYGVQNPVVSYKGEVLDGRNRLRAVMKLRDEGHKVDLPCVEWASPNGMTVTEWITAQNIDRRHLTDDQRVTIAATLQPLIAAEAREARKASQFDGDAASKAAKKRHAKAATADSTSPQKRDRKKSEARTTAAKLAKTTKTSTHKAKQAIALNKAVQSGAVSPEVQQAVMAGTKKLKDAVPAKPKGKAKPQPKATSDDVVSVDDERAAMRALVATEWDRLKKRFAVADLPIVRRVILDIVKDERKAMKD
jgi:ParB-like chromosome segregation protein Spo0J